MAADYERVIGWLSKNTQPRPKCREALARHVFALHKKEIAEPEVERIMERLFAEEKVVETGQTLASLF